MDIYKFVGILGLVIISVGVFWQKKYIEDLLYILGGIALFVYSYHIEEWIFVVLQVVFTISAAMHFVRLFKSKKVNG
jgi:hypothetical protein